MSFNEIKQHSKARFKCESNELASIREYVRLKGLSLGLSEEEAFKVSLAVDEACSNLVKHAKKRSLSENGFYICLKIYSDQNQFIVEILDKSQPFNPNSVPSPDMQEYFKQFKRGGLGIHIMRSLIDDIAYFPAKIDKDYNVLQLKKLIA
ncbi:MAG: ATP-binding protein [Ignavibacteria bacterium]|jgi:serine/threonine-protein kinase RsbW|nr:ATP-binding protein [Ignavibacteria bacterium]